MKYAWIQAQQGEGSVSSGCRVLEVARSGSYEWRGRPPRAPPDTEPQGQDKVPRSCAQGRGPYGTRRITPLWAQAGLQGSRRRLGRLLSQAGLRGKPRRRFKAPRAAGQAQTVAPHQRKREFTVQAPTTE